MATRNATVEDLADIHRRLDTIVEKLAPLDRVAVHEMALFGNGKTGLLVRLDRVEQSGRRLRSWMAGVWAFFGALIVAVVQAAVGR